MRIRLVATATPVTHGIRYSRLTIEACVNVPPESQTQAAFQLVLLRDARESERAKFAAYIDRHGLANACQLLLNTNEFLYLD